MSGPINPPCPPGVCPPAACLLACVPGSCLLPARSMSSPVWLWRFPCRVDTSTSSPTFGPQLQSSDILPSPVYPAISHRRLLPSVRAAIAAQPSVSLPSSSVLSLTVFIHWPLAVPFFLPPRHDLCPPQPSIVVFDSPHSPLLPLGIANHHLLQDN